MDRAKTMLLGAVIAFALAALVWYGWLKEALSW